MLNEVKLERRTDTSRLTYIAQHIPWDAIGVLINLPIYPADATIERRNALAKLIWFYELGKEWDMTRGSEECR